MAHGGHVHEDFYHVRSALTREETDACDDNN